MWRENLGRQFLICSYRATREALDELAARVEEQSRQLEQQNDQLQALQVTPLFILPHKQNSALSHLYILGP